MSEVGTDWVDIVFVNAALFGRNLASGLTEVLICGCKGVRPAARG